MEIHQDSTQQIAMNVTAKEPSFRLFDYDRVEDVQWMEKNWTYSIYAVVIYLNFIYFGQKYMKNRKPFDLRTPMVLWNLSLAAFSIKAFITVFSEAIECISSPNGIYKSVCQPWSDLSTTGRYYGWLFLLSKVVELGDTVFLVLRKKPVILLHWYHHVSVLCYCWYGYKFQLSTSSWFMTANVFVHSLMYTYYALVAMRFNLPRTIAMSITSLQLVQMVVGLTVNMYALVQKFHNVECPVPIHQIVLCTFMYASYFVLFSNFFRNVYFKNGKAKKKVE